MTKIIAMWSGPRNLSTAMMRSFGNRADCSVMDEPFYAACLKHGGMDHPMRNEIIRSHESDPHKVAEVCLNPGPSEISYQKHMMHQMLDGFPMDWVEKVTNVFLIRDPARVLASYSAKWDKNVTLRDIGYREQRQLYDRLRNEGKKPIVVDAHDIRANPEKMLRALCEKLEIEFDAAMLSWAPGPREEDGVWGKHWYDAIWKSTGFAPPENKPAPVLSDNLKRLYDEALPDYDHMASFRLVV